VIPDQLTFSQIVFKDNQKLAILSGYLKREKLFSLSVHKIKSFFEIFNYERKIKNIFHFPGSFYEDNFTRKFWLI